MGNEQNGCFSSKCRKRALVVFNVISKGFLVWFVSGIYPMFIMFGVAKRKLPSPKYFSLKWFLDCLSDFKRHPPSPPEKKQSYQAFWIIFALLEICLKDLLPHLGIVVYCIIWNFLAFSYFMACLFVFILKTNTSGLRMLQREVQIWNLTSCWKEYIRWSQAGTFRKRQLLSSVFNWNIKDHNAQIYR